MDMRPIIKAALFTPTVKGWGLPLLFWGEPGTSKSDLIVEVCEEYGMFCLVLSPGERGEGAFGVTPMPKARGESGNIYMSYPSPEWVLDIEAHEGRACIFIDELNTAQGSVKPALLGLIQSRRMAGEYLGAGVRVLGAANPPEDAADGSDLPPATANRVGHVDWVAPKLADWQTWLMTCDALSPPISRKQKAVLEEQRVLAAFTEAFSNARGIVTGYLGGKQSMLHKKPDLSDPALTKAWPSRRTWYLASVAIASAEVHGLGAEDRNMLIQSFVGEAARKELVAWEAQNKLPNTLAVLDGKVRFKHDPDRLDITRTVLNSCAIYLSDVKAEKRKERGEVFWSIMEEIVVDEGLEDMGIVVGRVIAKAPAIAGTTKRLVDLDSAKKTLKAIRPAMQAAGYALGG